MKSLFVCITGVIIFAVLGCAGSPVRTGIEANKNRSNLLRLNVGMSKDGVLAVMGEPYKSEVYKVSEEKTVEFWLYLTEATTGDGRGVGDRNLTPLAFSQGRLEGWGRNYYDNVMRVKQDITVKKEGS